MTDVLNDPTEYMLTTIDNPFDPFSEWESWLGYDSMKGYYTPGFLDRVVHLSDDMSEADQALAIQQGIDEIVRENVLGIYKKVSRNTSM